MGENILVLDAGTTSTRAILFAADGTLIRVEQRDLTQHYPRPGWVEHDAAEIWDKTLACAREAIGEDAGSIAAIGISTSSIVTTARRESFTDRAAISRITIPWFKK